MFDKHPLDGFSKVTKVWIDGHEYFDRDRDLETRPKFEQNKKNLLDKENATKRASAKREVTL